MSEPIFEDLTPIHIDELNRRKPSELIQGRFVLENNGEIVLSVVYIDGTREHWREYFIWAYCDHAAKLAGCVGEIFEEKTWRLPTMGLIHIPDFVESGRLRADADRRLATWCKVAV